MYRACIFDLDGTLANTLASIAGFGNQALAACGYPAIAVDAYRELVGNGANRLMRNMLDAVAANRYGEEDVVRLRTVYDTLYENDCMRLVSAYPGIKELLQQLNQEGIPLAVFSNKPHNVTTKIVRTLFGDRVFSCCYGQREGVPRKPAPDGALLIAKELSAPPEECLYIGDTNTDMITGAAAGMDTAGALWGFRSREELAANRAVYLVERPMDILPLVLNGR